MNRAILGFLVAATCLLSFPSQAADAPTKIATSQSNELIPVVIWQLDRESFKPVRHSWVVDADTMLRVTYDDGATWFAFKPVLADQQHGLLALEILVRQDVGRGEVSWVKKAALTLQEGRAGKVALAPATGLEPAEFSLQILEFKLVSSSELAHPDSPQVDLANASEGCCVQCGAQRACDCSACIPGCGSCCLRGCFCVTC